VSSVPGELDAERRAAREAVEQLRLTPVLAESGARPHRPGEVSRAYLEQSDVFVGIYWQQYGADGAGESPDASGPEASGPEASGMDAARPEDEFRLAAGMPRLLYVKRPAPDMAPELRRMLEAIRAEGGVAYKTFATAGELREVLLTDLTTLVAERFEQARDPAPASLIPAPVTALVGRDDDVTGLVRLLAADDRRLVVLTGAGGIGKTRLALAVLERSRDNWPDGVAFVDLSPVTDPESVPEVIASALGLVVQGRERPADTLGRRLGRRRMLLVLDNFEQVLAAAPVVADLLGQAPQLHLLVTSRVVLRVRGEQEWRVEPLPVRPLGGRTDALDGPPAGGAALLAEVPAVRLFVDRVRDARPGFELTDENAEAVAELCRRLDGLPLALELAAAQMRLLTPHMGPSSELWRQVSAAREHGLRSEADLVAWIWLMSIDMLNDGRFAEVGELLDAVLPSLRRRVEPARAALLLMERGIARPYTADSPAGIEMAQALEIVRGADDPVALGYVLSHYGFFLCVDGEPGRARALHEETLTIARAMDDENQRAEAHYDLAVDALAVHDPGSARAHLAAAATRYREIDHHDGLAQCLGGLTAVALERDDPGLGAWLIGATAATRDRIGLTPRPLVAETERRVTEQVRAALPGAQFTARVAAGRTHTATDALAQALLALDGSEPAAAW
jgi:hypothetical protein